MKKKNKQKLLIDKKECSNCGHILEKEIKVCDECGYDMTMEESLKIYARKFVKILNEQTTKKYEVSAKDPTKASPVTSTKVPVDKLLKTPGTEISVTAADEGKKKKVKEKKYNPWAICTASVGRKDKEKYEKCVMDVKGQYKMDEDLQRLEEYIERLIMDSDVNPKIKKGNFKQFVSKLK